jgi:predicted metal-dependent hydrolase
VTREHRISAAIAEFGGQALDARYLAYFGCFNQRLFFEAHEVLESLWLADREGSDAAFYKGLIQLAGAFVHLQKNRPGPAAALLRLADANLGRYHGTRNRLEIEGVRSLIRKWLQTVADAGLSAGLVLAVAPPELRLS